MQVGQVITQDLGTNVGEVLEQILGTPVGVTLQPVMDRNPEDEVLHELEDLGTNPETKNQVIAALVANNPEGGAVAE